MSIQTEYRGHKIHWSDNEDCWSCWDLSDKVRSSPKLSAIKSAIDRLYFAERKGAATFCWEVDRSTVSLVDASVVEYLGCKQRCRWNGETDTEHKVAVVARRSTGLSAKPSRAEKNITELFPKTAEFYAAWQEYVALSAAAKSASKAADNAFSALPRLTLGDVAKLVELASRDKPHDS
jgi:hypothetical protein